MKKNILVLSIAGALCLYGCGNSNNQDSKEVAEESNEQAIENQDEAQDLNNDVESDLKDNSEFMVEAASSGMLEVELGKAAQEKATSKEIKDFAQMMVKDHSTANTELKAVAAKRNVTLPLALGDAELKKVSDLREKTGTEFEEEYMDAMVQAHKKDVELFEEAAENSKDAEVKAFAAKNLPILRSHLEHAEKVDSLMENRDDASARNTKK